MRELQDTAYEGVLRETPKQGKKKTKTNKTNKQTVTKETRGN